MMTSPGLALAIRLFSSEIDETLFVAEDETTSSPVYMSPHEVTARSPASIARFHCRCLLLPLMPIDGERRTALLRNSEFDRVFQARAGGDNPRQPGVRALRTTASEARRRALTRLPIQGRSGR